MNVIREIERINAKELENGIYGGSGKGSWHEKYRNSAWVYIGGLPYELTEGDIICVMSQWGEIEDINLVREKGTNKSQGFAFVKYEDQRSTILAVDNFNGIQILQRTIRVDHVDSYKLPKDVREREEKMLEENPDAEVNIGPGHVYKTQELENEYNINSGVNLWEKTTSNAVTDQVNDDSFNFMKEANKKKKKGKDGKEHKKRKDIKRKRKEEKQIDSDDQNIGKSKHIKEHHDWSPEIVSQNHVASTSQHTGDSSYSWRGRYDPTAKTQKGDDSRSKETRSGFPEKEFVSGIGGMHRRR